MKIFLKKISCISLVTLVMVITPELPAQTTSSNEVKPATTVQSGEPMVDINTADARTLERQLEGIGPKKAAAIVEYREKHGWFKSISDLEQVYGIGEKTLERNRDKIKIVIPTNATESISQEQSSSPANPTVSEVKPPPAATTVTDHTMPLTKETNSTKGEEF